MRRGGWSPGRRGRSLVFRLGADVRRHRGAAALALGVALVLGLTAALAAPNLGAGAQLGAGQPSPGDIVAPRPASYVSRVLTQRAQDVAERAVAPVYGQRQIDVVQQQRSHADEVLEYVAGIVANPYADADAMRGDLGAVPELATLPARLMDVLLSMDEDGIARLGDELGYLLRLKMRSTITPSDVPVPVAPLIDSVDATMDAASAEIVARLASAFIVPNTEVDPTLTDAAREAARDAVPPQMVTYSAGQIIVRAGDPLREEQLEAMAQLGLLRSAGGWREVAALTALCAALVTSAAGALLRLSPGFWVRTRPLAMAVVLVLACAVAAQFVVPDQVLLSRVFPAAAVAMTLAVVLGPEFGLVTSALLAVVVGMTAGADLDMAVYTLLGGAAGVVVLGHIDRFSAFLVAALAVAAANLAVVAGFQVADAGLDLRGASELAAAAVAHGALSSGLSAVLILAAGPLFGVTTSVQLLELARPDHPLLRQLQLKAPGTYQHSILLGNLAEAAASAIGADVLMVRVAAYYHDIGKTVRPQFFIENQLPGQNPHDSLDPLSSARIVIAHVSDGENLARKHGLPEAIIAGILEHHGTQRAEYFFQQAVAAGEGEGPDDAAFRYPGPKPRSRETAIMMLADAAEAAVRAASPRTSDEMDAVLEKIFRQRVAGGQLDASDLTLRDLQQIREVFVGVLQSVYHPRIRYPEGVEPPAAGRAASRPEATKG